MKIVLKSIKNNLNYKNKEYKNELIEINSLFDWLSSSNKPYKNMHAFDVLLKENKEFKNKYLIDHTEYAPLYLLFNSLDDVLLYCQDTCEARAETIPKSIDSALSYLSNEDVYIHEIVEFDIDQKEWEQIKTDIKQKDKK